MKPNLMSPVLVCILSVSLYLAQAGPPADANDFKPASSNQPGREYPQVNSEGRVLIRVVAPEAQNIRCDLGGGISLAQGQNGVWTGTTRPLGEGSAATAGRVSSQHVASARLGRDLQEDTAGGHHPHNRHQLSHVG